MGRRAKSPDAIPHLRVRKLASGTTYYYYDHGGKPRREEPLGSDYARAIQRWAELECAGHEKARESITFRYVAGRYRALVIPTKAPRTQRDNMKELAKLLAFFDDPPGPLDAIKPQHVRQFMTWRSATAKVRANREKALLSHLWNFARDRGYTDQPNPCAGIHRNTEAGRSVYIDDAALELLKQHADAPLRDALDLAYLTGQRPADTLRMDERDVRDGVLQVHQGKTGARIRMQITGELVAVIKRIAERKAAMVVRSTRLVVDERGRALRSAALRYRFDKARSAAGIDPKGFQFRDLRAKAATDKADASGDVRQAQRQLGHTSVLMTEAYIRQRMGDFVTPTK